MEIIEDVETHQFMIYGVIISLSINAIGFLVFVGMVYLFINKLYTNTYPGQVVEMPQIDLVNIG